jgi:hypothetical protein
MLALFSLSPAFFLAETCAQDDSLKSRVAMEVPGAWARLETLYSRSRGTGRLNEFHTVAGKAHGRDGPGAADQQGRDVLTSSARISFALNGRLRMLDQTTKMDLRFDEATGSTKPRPGRAEGPSRSLLCIGPKHSFRLGWVDRDGAQTPVLRGFGDEANQEVARMIDSRFHYLLKACHGFFLNLDLGKAISDPAALRSVAKIPGAGHDHIKVSLDLNPSRVLEATGKKTSAPQRRVQAWLILSPDEGWSVRAIGVGSDEDRQAPRIVIDYRGEHEGLPLPSRISFIQPGRHVRKDLEIERFETGPVPEDEFELPAYGLPNIEQSPKSRLEDRPALLFLGGAIACSLLSLALRFYGKRHGLHKR